MKREMTAPCRYDRSAFSDGDTLLSEAESDRREERLYEQSVPAMLALDWCLREMGAFR